MELTIPGEPGNRITPLREPGIQSPGTQIIPLRESGTEYQIESGAGGQES